MDEIITGDRLVYLIRPQYGRLFDSPFSISNEIICRGQLTDI